VGEGQAGEKKKEEEGRRLGANQSPGKRGKGMLKGGEPTKMKPLQDRKSGERKEEQERRK